MKKDLFAVVLLLGLSTVIVSCGGGHKYVDLGLSSGTMWATCNIGAQTPEACGNYFSWGETRPKKKYTEENYRFFKNVVLDEDGWGREGDITKYNSTKMWGKVDNKFVLDSKDDAAHKRWGGKWRMPTKPEWDELLEECEWSWKKDGTYQCGYVVTGPNGNSIYLPAAGGKSDEPDNSGLHGLGTLGAYWSSWKDTYDAYLLYFDFSGEQLETSSSERHIGISIRPVCHP